MNEPRMHWLYWALGTVVGTLLGLIIARIWGTEHTFWIAFSAAAISTSIKKSLQYTDNKES